MMKCLWAMMMKRRREKTLLMMNVLATTSSSFSSWVSPSCHPARNNTICFQSEQKSETIFHQNGKYQISHLLGFIKQDLGGSLGIIFWYSLGGRSRYNNPGTRGPTSYIPNMDRHCPLLAAHLEILNPYQIWNLSLIKTMFSHHLDDHISSIKILRSSLIKSDQCDEPPCATFGHQPLGPIPPLFPRVY